ncbi:MAG: L-serine ammonia-lyase, iron-sulfur-dependent, subunit alpha [Bacteroidales bacterium]|jgi:L-cysteine desulfidase|nr:L-serine ammonia-lyase, iron-sulfur-dependent, subunit alpha [Bacteroidales bacterium]
MDKKDPRYQLYINILKEELVPAMGCTEPICLAYAAAKAHQTLGCIPDRVDVLASGNIIKNVKSVIVPNTNGMKGIKAAVAVGIIAGNPDKALEVIANVTPEQKKETENYLASTPITVKHISCQEQLDVTIIAYKGEHHADVRISGFHTNIVLIQKDDEVLFKSETISKPTKELTDRSCLSISGIVDFADSLDLDDVRETIGRQIQYNTAISNEGLKHNWGANIGSTLLKYYGDDIKVKAKARAAAGSDARMNGCELPVIINSGSGNQGLTVSMPVIAYAEEYHIDDDRLYRALVVSNLTAIHQKTRIGRLSAYCGAVSAGCAAACGIAYLLGENLDVIEHTLSNAVVTVSGIICDGAKASCAAKIAASVESGILGYYMYKDGQEFAAGDGIVGCDIEDTINNVGLVGSIGMKETDTEIIDIMTK